MRISRPDRPRTRLASRRRAPWPQSFLLSGLAPAHLARAVAVTSERTAPRLSQGTRARRSRATLRRSPKVGADLRAAHPVKNAR